MRHVLIVDDDLDIQLLLRLELSAEGYEVSAASNGREALDSLAEMQPDLILLDVMMPVLDGWGVLRELENAEVSPVVVMVSAFATDQDSVLRRALDLGAHDFVQKPFDPARLHAIIREALDMSDEERAEHRRRRLVELGG